MNDLEERLRAAFDARARTFEAGPHAWARVMERRPHRRPARWLLAALPVALLAVFVPVLLNGGLGRNTATDPEEVYRQLMRDRTPAGEQVTVDNPAEGKPLRLWFAKGDMGQPELCYITERADANPYGACGGMLNASVSWRGWFEGSTVKDGAARALDYGVAHQDVTAVGAVTKSGAKIPATLLRPEGAPFQIWTVTYTTQDPVSKAVFSKPGRADDEIPRSTLTQGLLDTDQQDGKAVELEGGVTVAPYKAKTGRTLIWLRQGENISRTSLERKYLFKDAPVHHFRTDDQLVGAARTDVAKLRMTISGRSDVTVDTRPDPWNLGLRLFTISTRTSADTTYTLVAYDAVGKEIWRTDRSPRQHEPKYGDQVGGTIILPGTEDFGYGPVRLWFVKSKGEGGGQIMLCNSGGVMYDGRKGGGCGSASFDDPNSFSNGSVDSFLPEPGATVSYGTAQPEWESVDAVLRDGRRIHGTFVSAPGAPARVWYVKYPYGTDVAAHVFKVKGRQLETVYRTSYDCWEAKALQGRGHALPRGITATLVMDNCVRFWKGAKELPGAYEPIPGGKLSTMLAPERPLQWGQEKTDWYGFTLPGTAKVTVTLKGGGTATATVETVPDPWGQGVMLFTGAVPEKEGKQGISWPGMRFTGYDADGHVMWTYRPGRFPY
ncbi:hypothetical protein [Nonomuraea sp. NPDC049784]|uniref:hypothetical protein n=1 Tax=Nonomuraea sp. NPDC049784 TaxID=3154361 RepID=UPI0033ECEC51